MATTLSDLKDRVRQRADKVNSTWLADAELTSYINASYAELYDLLVTTYEDYFITGPTSFTLSTSDAGVYSLPSDFYKLKGVDFQTGGDWITVYPHTWDDRNNSRISRRYTSAGDTERSYRMIGSNLRIEPSDAATGTYRLWYVPAYTALSSDTDEIDSIISRNNWEEYIVVDAAAKVLQKEESDASGVLFAKDQLRKRIEGSATDRDIDQPESVSDVRDRYW